MLTILAVVVFLKCSIFISKSKMVSKSEYSFFTWARATYFFKIGDHVPLVAYPICSELKYKGVLVRHAVDGRPGARPTLR